MLGLIVLVAICFGGYKLYKYLKENTDINVSPKGIIIGIGILLLGIMKLGDASREKKLAIDNYPIYLQKVWADDSDYF